MSLRRIANRLDQLEKSNTPDPESEANYRIIVAERLRRTARILGLPTPEEARFVEALSFARIQEAMRAVSPCGRPGFVAEYTARMAKAREKLRAAPPSEEEELGEWRAQYDRLLAYLRGK